MTKTNPVLPVECAFRYPAVVGRASDGATWCGTESWLVKDDCAKEPPADALDRLIGEPFTVDLVRVTHGLLPVLARWGDGLRRPYLRPDGITVWLDDAVVSTIESMRAREDEFGETVEVDFALRQAEGRFSMVGFHDDGELVAMAMPMRMINDHLTDGAGRPLQDGNS